MSIETIFVKDVYNKIAQSFSNTRAYLWRGVKSFILELETDSLVLDSGCGNGKNMFREDCEFIGVDMSQSMVDIVKSKGKNAIVGDTRDLPFRDNYFDACISIAVIHHIKDRSDRIKAINEMIRVTKSGGKIFIQVWEDMINKTDKFEKIGNSDYLVKWDNRDGIIHKRYYHLFQNGELDSLIDKTKVNIIDNFYECQNWCIILQKM